VLFLQQISIAARAYSERAIPLKVHLKKILREILSVVNDAVLEVNIIIIIIIIIIADDK